MNAPQFGDIVADVVEEWLPGYKFGPEDKQYFVRCVEDGVFCVYPGDKSGPGRWFSVDIVVRELAT